ncbi:glucuronate isomerase [Treponema sp. OMZ 840]|uniref:glucuronate isomerase n=1 Tax=Treponema sp. OMZ 840 TaxID=244313 RepID=UPI003D8BD0C5
MSYIDENFMLNGKAAKKLYENYGKMQPIFDYHCHLSPKEIYENKVFSDISELWLGGDHYKWRAMRAMGVSEDCITGSASSKDKFKAWAYTLEHLVGNPLYHWSHLELKRYFGIDELLTTDNWETIYNKCNEKIQQESLRPRTFITQSNVRFICTTDDPIDTLEYHSLIMQDTGFKTCVVPGFRPDKAFNIDAEHFCRYIHSLETASGCTIGDYPSLIAALENRLLHFKKLGSNVSDHGIGSLYAVEPDVHEANAILLKRLSGNSVTKAEKALFQTTVLHDLGTLYHKHAFVMQIHFGALRNNNSKAFTRLGADSGYDSIKDQNCLAGALNGFLDRLDAAGTLPKCIFYNLNPVYNDLIDTTIANFQTETGVRSKIQHGSGWWFNDTKRGMIDQMDSLATQGVLMNFVGMLTDSRSFMSYTRHEYFRRILCTYVGEKVDSGEFPDDEKLLKKLITNICYANAAEYFNKTNLEAL